MKALRKNRKKPEAIKKDQEKAELTRLCLQNFGRYKGKGGKDRFLKMIGDIFDEEVNVRSCDTPGKK